MRIAIGRVVLFAALACAARAQVARDVTIVRDDWGSPTFMGRPTRTRCLA